MRNFVISPRLQTCIFNDISVGPNELPEMVDGVGLSGCCFADVVLRI
jgi:hypothetical protein